MNFVLRFQVVMALFGISVATAQALPEDVPPGRLPQNTLIVKGAWSSASDTTTPLPEGGQFASGAYHNEYFGLNYPFADRWQQGLSGPPVSDSGYYVLAQIIPAQSVEADKPGHMLLAAQDIFFTPTQANNALELINFSKEHLDSSIYKVERAPEEVQIANHAFVRFEYVSPIAQMHWYVLATQIRCHVVEFIFTSRETKVVADLVKAMNAVELPAEAAVHGGSGGAAAPVCIKDYANPENVIQREDPILTEPRFNQIPVRIIIDAHGKVRHIHFLRAFPDQAKVITDALMQWRFKPHLVNGQPVEVETGIMFGRRARQAPPNVGPATARPTSASAAQAAGAAGSY